VALRIVRLTGAEEIPTSGFKLLLPIKFDGGILPLVLIALPHGLAPEAQSPHNGIGVGAEVRPGRHAFEQLGLSATQDDVIGLKAVLEELDHFLDVQLPLPSAEALITAKIHSI
jgi:hypothetical protein